MKIYYVYILECADNSYYTGITNNLERRLDEHSTGYNDTCYTYNRRPIKLVWYELINDVNHAIKKEKQIKHWSRKKKKALIDGEWERIKEYAKKDFSKLVLDTSR